MSKLNGKSLDILKKNIQQLQQLFPEIVSDGEVDFKALKLLLGEYTDDSSERYNFTWNGKSQALRNSQTPSMGTLRPNKEESKNWDTTANLYIEGDNLEVLKLLQKSYFGKIKMIYIDPPYNTGGDFVYKDDFKDSLKNYKEITGQVDGNGNATTTNREYSGRYHTDWLNMMYPRLRLARNLLTDDGVIFISIDDNEQANLKKLCDEVFGEENFLATIVWKRKRGRDNSAKWFSKSHEYLLVYAKNPASFEVNLLPIEGETLKAYRNPDDDSRGNYRMLGTWARGTQSGVRYDFINSEGIYFKEREWLFSKENLKKMDDDNRLLIRGDNIYRKLFLTEHSGQVSESLWENTSNAANASDEIKSLFGDIIFDTPKPIPYILHIFKIATDTNDLILDFFSGSATTAHAVMKLNAEDGGNRKFIMVQLPEKTDEKSEAYKAGYTNIAEIGKERIRRAGEKIKKELIEKHSQQNPKDENTADPQSLDIGFKVLKLDTSNIKPWNPSAYKDIQTALIDNISPYVSGRTEQDLVFELMLKMGLSLTSPIKEYTAGATSIYSIGFGALMICLSDGITIETANKMNELYKKLAPETWRVVCRDEGFASDSDKTNVKETLKSAGLSDDAFITL